MNLRADSSAEMAKRQLQRYSIVDNRRAPKSEHQFSEHPGDIRLSPLKSQMEFLYFGDCFSYFTDIPKYR